MGVYNEIQNDPSLMPGLGEQQLMNDNTEDIDLDEESNIQGISPEQQGEELLGAPTPKVEVLPELPDLTDKNVYNEMRAEQKAYMSLKGSERNAAKEEWMKKYWGSKKKYYDQFSMYGSSNPIEVLNNTFQRLSAIGQGLPDFTSNVIGTLPGLAGVDNSYDKFMMKVYTNPETKAIREISSIVLPSIITGNVTTGLVQKAGYAGHLTKLQQFGAGLGINTILDSGIVSVSDQGIGDNYFQKMYESNFMNLFGKDQVFEIREILRTTDQDSPWLRRFKNGLADLPWSFLGNLIGWGIAFKTTPKGSPILGWMEPLDDKAKAFKNSRIMTIADSDSIKRMEELNESLNSGKLSRADEAAAIDELIELEESVGTLKDIDEALEIDDAIIAKETDMAAQRKIQNNNGEVPDDFDPDITPGIVDSSRNASPGVGNVARNMADQAAIASGRSIGDPNPIITEAAMRGLGVNDASRKAVAGIAKSAQEAGRFDALIDGFKYTNEEMRAASWANYAEIVDPNSTVDDLRALFSEGKDIKNIFMGKLQVEYISDEKFKAAMHALRDLMDIYTGKPVTETSANVMTTLGAEIRTASESLEQYKGLVDDNAVMERVIDKIEFLLDETALSKYISGWSLQNKNWISETPIENLEDAAKTILKGIARESESIHTKNRKFVNTLRKAKDIRPEVLRPLTSAFVLSDGKVDTLSKLLKYAANEVSPLTLVKSPDPKKMSLFAKSLFGVVFNNVLSARSIIRAGVAGGVQTVAAPINSLWGAAFWGTINGDLPFRMRRLFYVYGATNHVHQKALKYSWGRLKAVHKDPLAMMRAGRKDFMFKTLKEREIVDDVREIWKADGNWGRVYQYDAIRGMYAISKMNWSRYPMIGMTAPDAYTQMVQAHKLARIRAFDDVLQSGVEEIDDFALRRIEIQHRNSFFNKDEMLTDKLTQQLSDDINFTGDDALSTYLTEASNAYPLLRFAFMFPRTESNAVKNALTYTPITLIPGSSKVSKTIYAKSADDIAQALAEHNVNAKTDPNADAIFDFLKEEYTGRIITSGLITKLAWDYAMSGGIMGPGNHNPAIREYERVNLGLQYKTIKIPGTDTRLSFAGIPIIDPLLSITGNMVYYSKELEGPMMEDIHAKVFTTLAMAFEDNKLESLNVLVDMATGNWSAVERFFKRATSSVFIPAEVRQLTRSIDGSLRNVNDNMMDYIKAQIPITVGNVPKRIDGLTGNDVYDHENGWVRVWNQGTGFKLSQDSRNDPDKDKPFFIDLGDGNQRALTTREALRILGYRGFSKFEFNTLNNIKLTSTQQQDFIEWVHSEKDGSGASVFFNKVREIVSSQKYHDHFAILRQHRANHANKDFPDLELGVGNFPMFDELDHLIREYKQMYEEELGINNLVEAQKEINFELEEGNINEAINIQKQNTQRQQLLQYGGSR